MVVLLEETGSSTHVEDEALPMEISYQELLELQPRVRAQVKAWLDQEIEYLAKQVPLLAAEFQHMRDTI